MPQPGIRLDKHDADTLNGSSCFDAALPAPLSVTDPPHSKYAKHDGVRRLDTNSMRGLS